jgi:hypothetical protein
MKIKIKLGAPISYENIAVVSRNKIKKELAKRGVPKNELDFFLDAYIALLCADASIVQLLILQQFREATEFLKSITVVVTKDQQEIPLRDMVD